MVYMIKNIVYIGASYRAAEFIIHNEYFNLKAIICEKNKMSDELFTLALVRNIRLYVIEDKNDLVDILSIFLDLESL